MNDPGGEIEVTSRKRKREIGKGSKRKCSKVCGCKVKTTWISCYLGSDATVELMRKEQKTDLTCLNSLKKLFVCGVWRGRDLTEKTESVYWILI